MLAASGIPRSLQPDRRNVSVRATVCENDQNSGAYLRGAEHTNAYPVRFIRGMLLVENKKWARPTHAIFAYTIKSRRSSRGSIQERCDAFGEASFTGRYYYTLTTRKYYMKPAAEKGCLGGKKQKKSTSKIKHGVASSCRLVQKRKTAKTGKKVL